MPLGITETETESLSDHMPPKLDVWGKGKVNFGVFFVLLGYLDGAIDGGYNL